MLSAPALSPHKQAVRSHFDALAPAMGRWRRKSRYYHSEIQRLCRFIVPAGSTVLELGSGPGDLLAALEPREGTGIDLSPKMIEVAQAKHPHLTWQVGDAEALVLDRTFDYVVLSDLVGHLEDIWTTFRRLHTVCHPGTRVVVTYYNYLWEPILKMAERVGQRIPLRLQNWLPIADIENLLFLADFEVVKKGYALLAPKYVPGVSWLLNRFVAKLPLLRRLCLAEYLVARPLPHRSKKEVGADSHLTCSVIIPCRNERGNIAAAVARVPSLGAHTEIVFVDGASEDGTREEIEKQIEAWRGRKDVKLVLQQEPRGKGEAVRRGFDAASGDLLMILDADLTVDPEDLLKFYQAVAEGKGDLINGTRLVYPMESQAMRTLNLLANKAFSVLFTWLLEQRITDTLCGTKVIRRSDYLTIKANRSFLGDFDPFGDFDLLFGAAKANLKILELPIRYRDRTYGTTKISRFRHGLLLVGMSWVAFRKLKLQ